MSFREIGGQKNYRNYALWTEGEYIIGTFTGTSVDSFGKTNYHIDVEETNIEFDSEHYYIPTRGKNKGKKVYDREIKVGETLGLNAAGHLDYKMNMVNEGERVKIIYTGTETLPENHQFAGSEAHQFDVLVAESDEVQSNDGDVDSLDSFTQL